MVMAGVGVTAVTPRDAVTVTRVAAAGHPQQHYSSPLAGWRESAYSTVQYSAVQCSTVQCQHGPRADPPRSRRQPGRHLRLGGGAAPEPDEEPRQAAGSPPPPRQALRAAAGGR